MYSGPNGDTWDVRTDLGCPSIVARDDEWAKLAAALDGLRAGRGALTCLVGEAGIGKSRLVAEVSAVARTRGVPLLAGRAVDDAGTPVPFRPLFEALSGYFRRTGPAVHPELDSIRETLAQLVPEWRRPGEQPYQATPMELGEALLRLLAGIAGGDGCVVILEDLHWADPDTAAVLEYLGDNIASVNVLCVATMRADTASASLRVARSLSSRRSATLVELRRLSAAEVAEMTKLCLRTDAIPEDVDALVRRFSDGLPFLVEELLGSVVSAGSLVSGPEGWHVVTGSGPVIPEGFAELVRRRLALLTDAQAGTLYAAAILGPRFEARLLPVITGQPGAASLEGLRAAVVAQLLIADPTDPRAFAFRHALTRDALLAQLLPFERLDLCRRVLTALEGQFPELPGSLCELAAGLAEELDDRARTAELLLLAARRACGRGALSSAEPMLERAWRFADRGDAVWLDIGSLLMTVLADTGSVDRALRVGAHLLAESPRSPAQAMIHLAMARAAVSVGRWADAIDAVDRARADAGQDAQEAVEAVADAIAAAAAIGENRYDDAERLASTALAVAERDDDHPLACEALLVLGRCARDRGHDGADLAFDRVIAIASDHNLPTLGLRGLMERGSLDGWHFLSNARVLAARDQAATAGALVVTAHLDNFLAWWARDHWAPDDVDAAVERCVALARKMQLGVLHGVALTAAATAAAQRGERDRMERLIAEAHLVSAKHADVAVLSSVARVTYWARRDDVTRMAAELEGTMEALRHSTPLPVPERGLWVLVRAVEDRGPEEAIAELDRSPGANHVMNQVYRTYALAVMLGRSGDIDQAHQHMARADGRIEPLAWFQHHARRFVAQAALTDGWGDPVAWLREALAYFDAGGYDELAGTCRALLAKAGAPVPRRAPAGDGGVPTDLRDRGVTVREFEVLQLLGEARSTRAIATQLYLSHKTVERHISNLVTKLGVNGRSGLVAFAASRTT